MNKRTYLHWGGAGVGKTAMAVSSFWDWKKEQPVTREDGSEVSGRLILVGRESNPDLGIPEEFIKRFPLQVLRPLQWVDDVVKYLQVLAAKKARGEPFDKIVLDGISEFNINFLWGHHQTLDNADNRWADYRDFKDKVVEIMQYLHPEVLGADVYVTARIAERKEEETDSSKKVTRKGDPQWMDNFDFYPMIDGFWKSQLGHYFNWIIYHAVDFEDIKKGKETTRKPKWRSMWLPVSEYMVKNTASHIWEAKSIPPILDNVSWPEVEGLLSKEE